jgi:hypothetical protein
VLDVDTDRTDLELRLIRARRSFRYRNMVTRWVSLRSTHRMGYGPIRPLDPKTDSDKKPKKMFSAKHIL